MAERTPLQIIVDTLAGENIFTNNISVYEVSDKTYRVNTLLFFDKNIWVSSPALNEARETAPAKEALNG
jgi:hypothetical protein